MSDPFAGVGAWARGVLFDQTKHRIKQLILRPLSHPFLPIWAGTKALEPGSATDYYVQLLVLSTVLYAIGDDIRAKLAEASDEITPTHDD